MESLKEFLERVDSSSPAPGGGAVAAYTASLAVALARMAMNVSIKRKSFGALNEEDKEYAFLKMIRLEKIEKEIYDLKQIDEDTFKEYMVAYKSKNQLEINHMTIKCFYVPYNLNKLIIEAIKIIFDIEKYVVNSVLSDYKMSLIMLSSMLDCCNENMLINLGYMDDQSILDEYNKIYEDNQDWIYQIEKKKETWR